MALRQVLQVGALVVLATGCFGEIELDHDIDLFAPANYAALVTSGDELLVSGCVAEIACFEPLPTLEVTIDGASLPVGVPDEPDFPESEQLLNPRTLPGFNFLRIPVPENPTVGLLVEGISYSAQVPVAPVVGGVTGTPSRARPLRLDLASNDQEVVVHVRTACGDTPMQTAIIKDRGLPTPVATQSQIEPQSVLLLLDQLAPDAADASCTHEVLVFSRSVSREGLTIERLGLAPTVTFTSEP